MENLIEQNMKIAVEADAIPFIVHIRDVEGENIENGENGAAAANHEG